MSIYREYAEKLGALVDEKQAAYGDSFGKSGQIMRILYPNGIRPEQMDDALCIVRIVDKLFRIATDRDALGESPYKDISGYGLLGAVLTEKKRTGRGLACNMNLGGVWVGQEGLHTRCTLPMGHFGGHIHDHTVCSCPAAINTINDESGVQAQ